jgi:hypothetical protein
MMNVNGDSVKLPTNEIPFISNNKIYLPLKKITYFADLIRRNNPDGSMKIELYNVYLSLPPSNKAKQIYISRVKYNYIYSDKDKKFENCCLETESIAMPSEYIIDKGPVKFIYDKFLFETLGGFAHIYNDKSSTRMMYSITHGWEE